MSNSEASNFVLVEFITARLPYVFMTKNWTGYLTVHDFLDQDTSLCMTPWTRIRHCA